MNSFGWTERADGDRQSLAIHLPRWCLVGIFVILGFLPRKPTSPYIETVEILEFAGRLGTGDLDCDRFP